ncbi:metal-dependent hydrolase [Salinadaptatus halalkaliphilus]|uniref:Metal-dependent hydrolase n=1 Tax=Salinadaptatus halalkaliphilus TaxID=2419781 RepID=A0A4S3TGE0_9EURY|nr:metal-dependent hydrolase [Salinadaptatus halalkaliphilus]THE63004.1 metal-dependent hydrolase [Salinadaptatus halalkaliphilus]
MWPLGHVAVAYICYTVSTRVRFDAPPGSIATLILVASSQFPDLVDKPLAWYGGVLPTGRTLGHSLLLLVPLTVAVYLLARRYGRGEYGLAFALGALSHTFVDAVPILWDSEESVAHLLWPLTAVEPYESGAPSVLALFVDSLSDPYFLSEFVFAAVAVALWRRDGYPGLEPIGRVLERLRPSATG